jgi:hypothetical protein
MPRKNATSMPLQRDQLSAPTEKIATGSSAGAPPGSRRNSVEVPQRNPSTDTVATSAAHTISSGPRNPTQYPSASTSGYSRLVPPLE